MKQPGVALCSVSMQPAASDKRAAAMAAIGVKLRWHVWAVVPDTVAFLASPVRAAVMGVVDENT